MSAGLALSQVTKRYFKRFFKENEKVFQRKKPKSDAPNYEGMGVRGG